MDEPLSNLDALIRLQVRAELKRLHRQIGSTTVYVTHDQVEALSLGDRIAVMKDGEIVQVDDPTTVYEEPANVFVGGFIGNPPMNFLPGELLAPRKDGFLVLRVAGRELPLPLYVGKPLLIGIRAEHIQVLTQPEEGALPATVLVVEPLGSHKLLTVETGGETLKVLADPDFEVEPRESFYNLITRRG